MIIVKKYSQKDSEEWDKYVEKSKNGTFLFYRNYMDYHSNRFDDWSLMIYRNERLYCLLPANRVGNTIYSHQGLTYGGLIMDTKVTASEIMKVFECINSYFKELGCLKVVYKVIPHIYHSMPAQEDLYAMFRLTNARVVVRNISSTIYLENRLNFNESRKSGMRKALANNIRVERSTRFDLFWDILSLNLVNKYGIQPVHSLKEIELLHQNFPHSIVLYLAYDGEIPIAGTVLYVFSDIVHTQYISASLIGKEKGALDLIFFQLINTDFVEMKYFDFGQSTEQGGQILNEALIFQKEGFGGRGVVYDIYEYDL